MGSRALEPMLPDEIRTERLSLRPFCLGDAGAVFDYSTSHPDWGRFQGLPSPYTPRDAEKWLAERILRDRDTRPSWAIARGGDVIGVVSLSFEAEHRIAVLGYGVHEGHCGRGFSGEGARAVLDLAFASYPRLRRVGAHTDARNRRSMRVLEKLGFTHEGTLRSKVYKNGEFVDDAVHGLLRGEWRGSQPP